MAMATHLAPIGGMYGRGKQVNLVMQRLAAEKNQKAALFKPGNAESAKGGLAKAGKVPVTMNSESPADERDRKASNAKTTVGKIAAAAGVTGTRYGR